MRSQRRLVSPKTGIDPAIYGVSVLKYSFYQLNPTHTRFGVVRRTSDQATMNVGFFNGFMDEAGVDAWRAGSACTLITWDEQVNGIHLQATVGKEPKIFDANGLIRFNGVPALKLENSNMDSITAIDWTNDFVFYSVLKGLSSATQLFFTSDLGSGVRIAQLIRSRWEFITVSGSTGRASAVTQDPINLALGISIRNLTGNKQALKINEFISSPGLVGGNIGSQILRMGSFQGANFYANGYVSEAQLYLNGRVEKPSVVDDIKSRHSLIF